MRFGAGAIVRAVSIGAVLYTCSTLLAVLGPPESVYAENSRVQATVNSGTLHPALGLTEPVSPLTIDAMPVTLTGVVSSLTQIQVYVDSVFSVTIPLDEGATAFSYDLVLPSGSHTVKLVGVSPFVDISPTVSLAVTYTPPSHDPGTTTASTDSTASSGSGAASSGEKWGGAVISRDGATVTKYAEPAQATTLPGWLYNGLLALDIARPGDDEGHIAATAQRAAVLAPGFFLVFFARPALYGYYSIRYRWFGLRACKLSAHARHAPLLRFRVLGILLIIGVFSFS